MNSAKANEVIKFHSKNLTIVLTALCVTKLDLARQ